MSDIGHSYNNDLLQGDLVLEDGLLATDSSLYTAVLHSLFSDARALDDDPLEDGEGRRGWWGDLVATTDGDAYGSRLWELRREKQTAEVRLRAEEYAKEALAWLIDDGVASEVTVDATYPKRGLLALKITITLASGALQSFVFNYSLE